jgi:hypothetical protein
LRSENLGEKIGVTYHQSVSKELALALNLQQVDKKGVSLALGSSYTVRKQPTEKVDSPPWVWFWFFVVDFTRF